MGCVVVLVGAYLISIDAKNKMAREKRDRMKKELVTGDPETVQLEAAMEKENKNKQCFLVELAKSIWNFKAGLYIMGVSLCW